MKALTVAGCLVLARLLLPALAAPAAEPIDENPIDGGPSEVSLSAASPSAVPEVYISEFMADNAKTLRDDDGDNSDWIELFNASDATVSLKDWSLTDDGKDLAKWRFPDVAIAPKSFLVVFASEKNRTNSAAPLHTNFKLATDGEYLALVSPQQQVVSEFGPAYPPQFTDVSYGRAPGEQAVLGYFTLPTPGAANSDSGPGFAPEVTFSQTSRTFTVPFMLNLRLNSSHAVIRYTLDGSLPTNSSPAYLEPISITNSVQVRARAYQEGLLPGPARTETYLLLSNNVANVTSDLPLVVIHSLGKGIPSESRQTFAHISIFEPVDGVSSLANPPSLVTRSGIKVRGSSTGGLAKSSFAVELWDEYNQDKHQEVLGLPVESDWVLYAPNQFEPVLIHNPFVHQLSREMGRYSPRTRFVEVYLNKGIGPISAANYNGIYVLEEKVKVGPHRVDIDRLQPENTHMPEVSGGYLMKIDRLDPGDSGFSGGGQRIAYIDPKEREIKLPQRDPQEQFIKSYFDGFGRALNSTNWTDPVRGYAAYIDVDSWIDFHVLELLSGNVDAIVLSTYFHKPRSGKIVFGPHWDFDRALGSTDGRDANPRLWQTGPFFGGWWARLFRDPDFWQKWIDRYQDLRGSLFSQNHINQLIEQLAGEVRQAQPRERLRWKVAPRGGTYQAEVDRMKTWLSNRMDFIDRQLVQPPRLSAASGRVTPGYLLSITGPTNATIYFTRDGSDPRQAQGSLAPSAELYTGPIVVAENVRVVARARNVSQRQNGGPPVSSPWSKPVVGTLTVATPPLALTEIMFHPESAPGGTNSELEFIELKNVSSQTVELAGYHFTHGVEFRFTTSDPWSHLAPGERVLVVKNRAAFQASYPGVTNVAGEFAGSLSNAGNRLTLVGPLEEPIFDVSYKDSWQRLADGFGFSLVPADETLGPDQLNEPARWRLSASRGGSPGQADSPPPRLPHVLINELLTYAGHSTQDTLELFNSSTEAADISGWYLTDDFRSPKKFRLSPGLSVPAGGYLVLNSMATLGADFAFSKLGEQVYLFSADAAGSLTGWAHGFAFGTAEPSVSFGRYVNSLGQESFVAQTEPSFGQANRGPRVGPLVISQILLGQPTQGANVPTSVEYIQLRNLGAQPVRLFDPGLPARSWRMRGAVDFDFPANTVVPGNGSVLLVGFDPQNDLAALAHFRSRYGVDAVGALFGPWRGHLSGSHATIRLLKPAVPELSASAAAPAPHVLVEEVNYSIESSWPVLPSGVALVRRDLASFADDPGNWFPSRPSPSGPDSDGDGLPDDWETANGFDPLSVARKDGPDGDPDGDGQSNLQEFLSGTRPRDPGSQLRLDGLSRTATEVMLVFTAGFGRSYTVEYRDNLAQGWQVLRSVIAPAAGGIISIVDTPTTSQRFYRLSAP